MRNFIRYVMCAMAALFLALGIGTATANGAAAAPLQVTCNAGCKGSYITANAVRLRMSPGGKALGLVWRDDTVYLAHEEVGQWVAVVVYSKSVDKLRYGWVSRQYIGQRY